ncbi:DNA repair protein RecN [[Clostridium] scindens]|uniref:DNA repair protein RecN n=1 Tax=Clostridium scindens (strain JCM 10418 / VPI 12708) TaxID=29347 RepID=UPI001D0756E4|nr:DNA repair protein RecN [[Clostridium] scindens]MCB6645131.1 DNA repair protein RecN [[Clostridium] scindens]
MLQNLHVKNLALIDEIEVEFKDGLNILTGETGAGKSIILGSISLALGGRYTKDILRQGAEYGFVELTFLVENESQQKKLEELDIFPEEGMVTLSRRLMAGRSVSRINGETVQMGLLKEASSILIDIHGQHEHQSLLYKKNHLGIVDAFAKEYLAEDKEKAAQAYKAYKACEKELKEAEADESQRAKELSFLKFEVSEIQEAHLLPGEDEELESLYRRMTNSKKIADSVNEAYLYTSEGGGNASEALSRAIRALSEASEYDDRAAQLYGQLVEVDSLLNDFNRELADYSKTCEFSDEEFYETENRLNEINHLKTKYGDTIEKILDYCASREERIGILEDFDNYILRLKDQCAKAEEVLRQSTARLTKIRKKQAKILEEAIEEGLKDLNFENVKFRIQFESTKDYTAEGMDDIEFMISLNPGQPVKPLAGVASGGELSRIMLAIKTVMAKRDDIETLIFDEIDVGISGRTAQKVSEKMALIGKKHQVICITHLAQIAAMADHHYMIEKSTKKGDTKTSIELLDEKRSIEELARILGGAKITDTVVQSAVEMKELAKQTK